LTWPAAASPLPPAWWKMARTSSSRWRTRPATRACTT